MMKELGNIRYVFRHYPVNQMCNPVGAVTKHEHACKAAVVAEAAGILGGSDAYWKAHEYLMEHQANFSDATIQATAEYAGLNLQQLRDMMNDPKVNQAIGDDARVARALGLTSIPYIYINDKYLARWTMTDGGPLLDVVIKEAAGQK
jgi:protein-disulfide isomerase